MSSIASSCILPGPQWPGVRVFATTRLGGVSDPPHASWNLGLHVGDDPVRVQENRVRLEALLPRAPLWLEQVHGVDAIDADAPGASPMPPRADAAATLTNGRPLAIMTADCLPVVIAAHDAQGAASGVAVAHAGWRGLAAGVLENAVMALRKKIEARTPGRGARLQAWVGPAIGQAAFEVGDEVRAAFALHRALPQNAFVPNGKVDAAGAPKWQADLPLLAEQRLLLAGVDGVLQCGICTVQSNDRFFSYRKEGRTGRFATLAWLEA